MKLYPRPKDLTEVSSFLFNIIGVKFFKYGEEDKKTVAGKIIAKLLLANVSIHLVFQSCYPFFEPVTDTVDIIKVHSLILYSFNSLLKFWAVCRGRVLLHEILESFNRIHPSTEQDRVTYRVRECYSQIRIYGWSTALFNMGVTTTFNFGPMSQSLFECIFLGKDFVRRFPFYILYPFDVNAQPFVLYLVVYVLQNFAGWTMLIFYAGPDLLLIEAVQVICMHFKYLAQKIENFEPTGTDEDLEELKHFISYHQLVLSLSFNINEVCNISILMNYFVSGGILCVTAFQMTIGFQILDLLKSMSSIILSLAYVYLICYFGTNLMEVSNEISQAVFSHKWYMGNAKYRKMMPLLIIRAQKPVFLSAFKFFTVSMESFTMVVKSSYQMFTLLRTRYQEA